MAMHGACDKPSPCAVPLTARGEPSTSGSQSGNSATPATMRIQTLQMLYAAMLSIKVPASRQRTVPYQFNDPNNLALEPHWITVKNLTRNPMPHSKAKKAAKMMNYDRFLDLSYEQSPRR